MEYEEIELIDLREYLALIRRWLWLIVLMILLAGATALIVSLRMPPIYQAEAGVVIVRSGSEIVLEPRYSTFSEIEIEQRRRALTTLATNSAIAPQVIAELSSMLEPEERRAETLVGMVRAEREGDLIRILSEADSPEKAAAIATAWAHACEGYVNSLYFATSRSDTELRIRALQIQADEALAGYQEAEVVLTEFLGNNQIATLTSEIDAKKATLVVAAELQIQTGPALADYQEAQVALTEFLGNNRIATLTSEIAAKKAALEDYYSVLRSLDRLLADAKGLREGLGEGVPSSTTGRNSLALLLLRATAAMVSSGLPVELQVLLDQQIEITEDSAQQLLELDRLIANLEIRQEQVQALIDDGSLQQEILELEEQLERESARKLQLESARDLAWGTYRMLAGQEQLQTLIDQGSLQQEILQLEEQLERESATKLELESARDLVWETYQMLVREVAEKQVAGEAEEPQVRFATAAVEPGAPIRPRTKRNTVLASVVGAMLAVGVSFFIEYLDDSIKTPKDVRRALGLSTLSSIAPLPAGAASGLITVSQPGSPTSEGLRVLRTQLQIATDKPLEAVLVTSPNPLEGKSTIVANLGAVMAQAGRSTIIVDSDMRRPVLHEMFGLANAQGLSNVLSEDGSDPGRFLQATDVENLRVLTSGPLPPNPSELLSLPQMERLIQQLRSEADVLLFDSPAALAVTDAALLAEKVDGVLLVVESGGTRRGTAQQAVDGLTRVGANLVGVVLNRFQPGAAAEYYYHEGEQGRRKANRGRQPFGRRLLESVVRRVRGR